MKINALMEECRKLITPEIDKQVDFAVEIANYIYDILEEKGMSQKDLARKLGKSEAEVSRMLSGTHNMTLATIAKISVVLEKDVIKVPKKQQQQYATISYGNYQSAKVKNKPVFFVGGIYNYGGH